MYITNSVLENLINFLGPVVGIALIIFCVIEAFKILSGNAVGSVKNLITGTLILLFILGIMYTAGSFDTYGKFFQNITDNIITRGTEDIESLTH